MLADGGNGKTAPAKLLPVSRSLQVLTALFLIGTIAATGHQLWHTRETLLSDTEHQMARLDMVFAEQTGRAVETVDLILRASIEAVQALRPQSPAEFDAIHTLLSERIAGIRQVKEIAITDRAGHVISSSRSAPPPELSMQEMPFFQFLAQHPDLGLQISQPTRGNDGNWSVLMVRPIHSGANRAFDGVAIAYLDPQYFEDFYKAVDLGENGVIMLHRRDGIVLARYPNNDKIIGTSYADLPPFKDILAHAIAGTVRMDSPIDGSRRVLAIRALKLFPLAVNVSVDEGVVLAEWRRQGMLFIVAALLASITIGWLMLMLAHRSRRLEALLQVSQAAKNETEVANQALLDQMAERERAEAALRQAQRMEAVGQLTGGVAHDFNNLLTVILGSTELIGRAPESDPAKTRLLTLIRSAAERGATVTSQLLAFSRKQPLKPGVVDLNGVVRGMNSLLQSALGSTIRIETILQDRLQPALVDPTQLELVILNLAINARDAMPTGGVLTIETSAATLGVPTRSEEPPPGNYLTVTVRDVGFGMSAEVQAKVFEPFFTTKGPGRGSGLGLSQVLGFAHQSGGGVRIDSNSGAGTSVKVYLPPARSAIAPETVPPPASAILETTQSVILLVDDDDAVRTVTAGILASRGYGVIEASRGSAALDILAREPQIDVLLADVAMPEMNGPEVARRARRLRPGLPIVFFSGYADPEALAGEAFAEVLLRKPFNPDDLARALETALRR